MLWGVSTTAVAAVAGEISARRFGFWFQLTQTAVVLIPAVIIGLAASWRGLGVAIVVAAGVLQAAGLLTFRLSVSKEKVGVVAPLIALEGGFVAMLAVAAGEALSLAAGLGLLLAVTGGWIGGASHATYRITAGSGYAVLTAAIFGTALWLLARSDVEPVIALLIFNGVPAALFIGSPDGRGREDRPRAPSRRQLLILLVAGLGSIGGQLAFVIGIRAGAGAVTAVLSAQSSLIAVLGGYLVFHERLHARQLAGFAVLLIGVSLVAVATT